VLLRRCIHPTIPHPEHTIPVGDVGVSAAAYVRTAITEAYPYKEPTGKDYSVFISHAGKQKHLLGGFLKKELEQRYPALKGRVFLDDISLERGDDAMDVIYTSLRDSFVGKCRATCEATCVACKSCCNTPSCYGSTRAFRVGCNLPAWTEPRPAPGILSPLHPATSEGPLIRTVWST
jgi:hypothetical protein